LSHATRQPKPYFLHSSTACRKDSQAVGALLWGQNRVGGNRRNKGSTLGNMPLSGDAGFIGCDNCGEGNPGG
jgi:hypothetical protein